MKSFLLFILYKLVEVVEFVEYWQLSLDENDVTKKIVQSSPISINVSADTGYVPATHIHKTQPYRHYRLTLANGSQLVAADNHLVFTSDLQERFVCELSVGDTLYTQWGALDVTKLERLPHRISMFDLSIDTPEHRYYTNGILSHNTVSVAIFILHFCTFNTSKNIMIAANKRDTVNEIVSKIKEIYYLLPFFIQPSISNWNQSQITFGETKCRIKTTAATKTAAVGFTCDLLYMDEMALIPNNIAYDLYRSIFPTISAVQNSKIIVTSTPNGYNLFWQLLSGAEKPDGDPDKNDYKSMRVYWWQVPGRYVTYLRLNKFHMTKLGITANEVYSWVLGMGFEPAAYGEKNGESVKLKDGVELVYHENRHVINIPNRDENLPEWLSELKKEKEGGDNFVSDYMRSLTFVKGDTEAFVRDFSDVSSWKEDAVKNIGSEEAFNQEYDLQFMAGNKMLFNSQIMDKLKNAIYAFKHRHVPIITKGSFVSYDNLTWIDDKPDLFSMENIKDYYVTIGVDLAEGMGGDSSVINIFRIMLKPEEEWGNIKTMYDLFKLEQIGIYTNNYASVQDVAELLYLLCFEVFDSDKVGVVLESNNWGNEVQKTMLEMYSGRNSYSNHIFFRYKHRQEDKYPSVGIKLRQNKEMLVKTYQTRIKAGDIVIHEILTLREMTTFIKKDNGLGSVKYEADAGSHDDVTMTIVELSSVFEHSKFHDMVNRFIEKMPIETREKINTKMGESPYIAAVDYSIIKTANTAYANRVNSKQMNANKLNFGSRGYDTTAPRY